MQRHRSLHLPAENRQKGREIQGLRFKVNETLISSFNEDSMGLQHRQSMDQNQGVKLKGLDEEDPGQRQTCMGQQDVSPGVLTHTIRPVTRTRASNSYYSDFTEISTCH